MKSLTQQFNNPLNHYSDALSLMMCRDPTDECHQGLCKECPGIKPLEELLISSLNDNDVDQVKYKRWVGKPRANLETTELDSPEFVAEFCAKLQILLPHAFLTRKQANFVKNLRESLKKDEFLIICDFAENYAFLVQNAIGGFHWNNDSATLYTVAIYYKLNDIIEHRGLVIVSDCMVHDAIAVHVYAGIINEFVKTISDEPKKFYYCSDGAPSQYKNFKYITNLYYHLKDYGVLAEHHYFETSHGKSTCDGLGGTVKRAAARASLQMQADQQITTPKELAEWCQMSGRLPNITVKYSPKIEYEEATVFLQDRFSKAKTIPGTKKFRCIIPQTDRVIHTKTFSDAKEFDVFRIENSTTTTHLKRKRNKRQ